MSADGLPAEEPLDRRVTIGLAKIGMALKQQAWAEAGGRGLTPTQGQVLALLRANSGGLRLRALAEQLGVTAATASDSVAALHRKGMVAKEPTARDGRGVVVVLTPTGSREAAAAAVDDRPPWAAAADCRKGDVDSVAVGDRVQRDAVGLRAGDRPVDRRCRERRPERRGP